MHLIFSKIRMIFLISLLGSTSNALKEAACPGCGSSSSSSISLSTGLNNNLALGVRPTVGSASGNNGRIMSSRAIGVGSTATGLGISTACCNQVQT